MPPRGPRGPRRVNRNITLPHYLAEMIPPGFNVSAVCQAAITEAVAGVQLADLDRDARRRQLHARMMGCLAELDALASA